MGRSDNNNRGGSRGGRGGGGKGRGGGKPHHHKGKATASQHHPQQRHKKVVVTFNSTDRHDYLTGFSSRKKERRAFGLAMQKVKDRQSKLEERKESREAQLEKIEDIERNKAALRKGLAGKSNADDDDEGEKSNTTDAGPSSESMEDNQPKRPSPPKYVVALSSMEITVGGNGNETQQFNAGDVIFVEDTWWGVWNSENEEDNETEDMERDETKMKGYIMRASSESETEDLNVLMLTVPNAIHRHWKNAQLKLSITRREEEQVAKQQEQKQSCITICQ